MTVLPPKLFFQPECEVLSTFDRQACFRSVIADEPFVLLGVHPYDLVAIAQMDAIFAQGNNDVHYQARRERATLVAVDVQSVSPNVFAGYMGTSSVEEGYDVLLTRIDGGYLVDGKTDKGAELMAELSHAPDADARSLEARRRVWEDNRPATS